jgi:uncharacterized protein YxeA
MKKFVLFCMTALLSINVFVVSSSAATNTYGEFNSFIELEEAYYKAIKDRDIDRQNELLKIADETLNNEVLVSQIKSKFDPDERVALQGYDKHISSSSWITRYGMISLSITAKSPDFWSPSDKSTAWNGVFAKHYKHSNWKNPDSMRTQFYRDERLGYATIKSPLNIEPGK